MTPKDQRRVWRAKMADAFDRLPDEAVEALAAAGSAPTLRWQTSHGVVATSSALFNANPLIDRENVDDADDSRANEVSVLKKA